MIELAIDDHLLHEEDALQLVHAYSTSDLIDLQHLLVCSLNQHHIVIVGEDVRIDESYLLLGNKNKPYIILVLHFVRPYALK